MLLRYIGLTGKAEGPPKQIVSVWNTFLSYWSQQIAEGSGTTTQLYLFIQKKTISLFQTMLYYRTAG